MQAPFLHPRDTEASMAAALGRRMKARVRVACQEIVPVRKGELFRCRARYRGRSRGISARLTDGAGHFRYRLAERRR